MKPVKEVCRACRSKEWPLVEPTTGEGFDFRWDECRLVMCPAKAEEDLDRRFDFSRGPKKDRDVCKDGFINPDDELPERCKYLTEQVVAQERP
jgi:hypothetical protein